ncbi:MAG: hypothetical protein AAF089_01020 [Bacteroidota bacterium]
MSYREFPCTSCGAELRFAPGTDALQCPYCGVLNEIKPAPVEGAVGPHDERDYERTRRWLAHRGETLEAEDRPAVKCTDCGAETSLPNPEIAGACSFCGSPVVYRGASTRLIKPQAVLPFKVTQREANEAFKKWVGSRWFAPSALKEDARGEVKPDGMYLPYWTYDARTHTRYSGQRGEWYYVNESYTTTVNGKRVQRTRRVRKTRWYPAGGRVRNAFDDLTVAASETLPRGFLHTLEPWDLDALDAYDDRYLAGFRAEHYTVALDDGFGIAADRMQPTIDAAIRRDIGGDEQRITQKDTRYHDVTFKHVLLPLWISAYRFDGKTYRFLVNARTGEVTGDRPYSKVKIGLVILLVVLLIALFIFLNSGS